MKPTRARELLHHTTRMVSPMNPSTPWIMRTIECSDIRKHMTQAEIDAVNRQWQTMPGNASFRSALAAISRNPQ